MKTARPRVAGTPVGYCHCGCGKKTNLAPVTRPSRGWVEGEPLVFLHGHRAPAPIETYYAPFDGGHDTECWRWSGAADAFGYGTTRRHHKAHKAHRYVYELRHGPVPAGLVLDHLCRNPWCVNPDHLEAVTQTENVRRGNQTILTQEQVRAIRADGRRHVDIAVDYGVAAVTIGGVKANRSWKDVA